MKNVVPLPFGGVHLQNLNQETPSRSSPLTILTWNIKLSRKYKQIISYLKDVNADIVFLQEVDWGQERTKRADVPREIAEALQMNYAFATEFEEQWSILRQITLKTRQAGGIMGNVILSKFALYDPACILLPQVHMYNGIIPTRGIIHFLRFPAQGHQTATKASIRFNDGSSLALYSTHLAIMRASMRTRIAQYQTIVADAQDETHAIIAGDFNTAAHGAFGIYNSLENLDAYYLKNIFTPEAIYWHEKVIPETGFTDIYHKKKDWTLKVGGIYRAKLDWILTKGVETINASVGPLGHSDHKPLIQKILLK